MNNNVHKNTISTIISACQPKNTAAEVFDLCFLRLIRRYDMIRHGILPLNPVKGLISTENRKTLNLRISEVISRRWHRIIILLL